MRWEVGIVLEEIIAATTTLIGDRVTAACSAVGVAAPFSQISQRAVPNALGGQIELGGLADWVVAFTDMKIAFDALRGEINAAMAIFNAHTQVVSGTCSIMIGGVPYTGTIAGTAAAPTTSMINAATVMDAAKVTTVMVP